MAEGWGPPSTQHGGLTRGPATQALPTGPDLTSGPDRREPCHVPKCVQTHGGQSGAGPSVRSAAALDSSFPELSLFPDLSGPARHRERCGGPRWHRHKPDPCSVMLQLPHSGPPGEPQVTLRHTDLQSGLWPAMRAAALHRTRSPLTPWPHHHGPGGHPPILPAAPVDSFLRLHGRRTLWPGQLRRMTSDLPRNPAQPPCSLLLLPCMRIILHPSSVPAVMRGPPACSELRP